MISTRRGLEEAASRFSSAAPEANPVLPVLGGHGGHPIVVLVAACARLSDQGPLEGGGQRKNEDVHVGQSSEEFRRRGEVAVREEDDVREFSF